MNEKKEKTIDIIIPKGYRSFKEEIKINLNKGLNVITGVNGSGKTQLLEYFYFNKIGETGKDSVLLRTTAKINITRSRVPLTRSSRYLDRYYYDDDYNNVTINEILDDIETEYKKYIFKNDLSSIFIYQSAVYNAMFVNDNFLYNYKNFRIEFFGIIAKIISEIDDNSKEQILKDFGIIDKKTLKQEGIKKLKKDGIIKKGAKKYKDKIQEFMENDKYINERKEITKNYFNKYNIITSKQKLIDYINNILTLSNNLNGIIIKLSTIIYNEAIEKAKKTRTKKIWEQINEILDKYNNFNYILEEPDLRIGYKVSFKYKNNKNPKESVPFENLSSGEKIIFELICYAFIIKNNGKNNKTKMLLLDEFDANLNPQLSELLIKTIREELIRKGITVILTTHSPSTVAEVEPEELFLMKNENGKHILIKAENDDGKKEILETLAPKFVYQKELGFMGILAKTPKKYIIFVEGKSDKIHFETAREYLDLKDDYEFIDCGCASHIANLLQVIKDIELFNNLLKEKIIIGLCDFDNDGCKEFSRLINKNYKNYANNDSSIKYTTEIHEKINKKSDLKFDINNIKNENLKIKLLMLTPTQEKSVFWKVENFEIEHMYSIENYKNERGDIIGIMKKIDKTKIERIKKETIEDYDYNDISFKKNPEYYEVILNSEGKIKFAEYVSKHPDEFNNTFKNSFKKMFDIINDIK